MLHPFPWEMLCSTSTTVGNVKDVFMQIVATRGDLHSYWKRNCGYCGVIVSKSEVSGSILSDTKMTGGFAWSANDTRRILGFC